MAEPIQSLMKPQSRRDITFQRSKDEMAQKMAAQGFTNVKDLGGGMTSYTLPERASGGQVGQSFGRMIGGGLGGGIPSMGGLEAASMRLADAAAKRERETKEFEYGLERKSKSKDIQISQAQSKIEQIKQDIKFLQESPPSINKNAEIEKRRQALQRAENELNSLFRE